MVTEKAAEMTVNWPSNDFDASWHIKWSLEELHICADWHSLANGVEALLADHPRITLTKARFLSEWKRPIATILRGLRIAGYSPDQITDIDRLQRVHDMIPEEGFLYTTPIV